MLEPRLMNVPLRAAQHWRPPQMLVMWLVRVGGIACVLVLLQLAQADDLRVRMAALLRYTGVENAGAADIDRMTELWTRAQKSGLSTDERRAAFRDMYLLYNRLHGRDLAGREQVLDPLVQRVTAMFDAGGRMDLALPSMRGRPSGNYLQI
ncbi:MAG TPA: hypothetical protein VNB49_04815, partial [Candidatus Dormibacteraeota bacterium]|nr:hypothetical protein [Candidatus Dormibacteraeota bacterium]